MIEVKVPSLGESIVSARVAKLLVAGGTMVKKDDNLCVLDTEKISLEVIAPDDGLLTDWHIKEGDDVAVDGLLASIDNQVKTDKGDNIVEPVKNNMPKTSQQETTLEKKPPAANNIPNKKENTENTMVGYQPPPHIADERGEERVKMSKLRELIAKRLKYAQNTAATLTTFNEVDMSLLIDIRQTHQEKFQQEHGTKLGFMSFFVKAVCAGLKSYPIINAEIDGDDIIYKNYYDIGIAVGSPSGLVVPILRDANKKSFATIEQEIADFGKRSEDGRLTLADLSGGTFTITNGGIFGSMLSTPILNPPQSAILGMHKIEERPLAKNGMITIAPVMYLALSYDHRIIDGREAVSFLTAIKNLLERPERLMLDI
ncbi:MAG: dihydrolipoyllysine-residue succinyltransferase [Alphaproteobacteria bacterium]